MLSNIGTKKMKVTCKEDERETIIFSDEALFFLEHAGEMCIIILRRKSGDWIPLQHPNIN
jgi:hypothetical protein